MTPLVSVILPTYNWKDEWISKSIESVLNQTFKDFELIIINDCSKNNVEEVIKRYQKNDSRIIYLKNEENLKITKTLNRWISVAKWKYIARIDDDDIWNDNKKLEKQVEFMENNEDYWLCWVWRIVKINENWDVVDELKLKCSDRELRESILQCNQFAHPSVLLRKSILDEVWVYDPQWNMVEDYELWLRIWLKSKFSNLENTSIKYRINSKWISSTNKKKQMQLWWRLYFKYCKFYPWAFKAFILRIWDFVINERYNLLVLNRLKKYWLI